MSRFGIIGILVISAFSLQACGSGDDTRVGAAPIRQFTSWADVLPLETVIINGEVVFADYTTDLQSGVTTAGGTQNIDAEATLVFDGNLDLAIVDIQAGGASIDFDEIDGDVIAPLNATVGAAVSANGQDIALVADPDALGFNYQTFGVWLTGYNTGAGIAAAGSFGAMSANVPAVGIVTYNGGASGFAIDAAGTPYLVISASEVGVNFTNNTFTFETTGSLRDNLNDANDFVFVADNNLNLSGAGTLAGINLDGSVNAVYDMSGSITGWMYGDNGSEVGGLFDLAGPDGSYVGSFGAVD